MLAPNWITVKHHQTIKSWITIQWFSLDFARTDPFEVLIADVSQTPTVLWTVGLPLISASFHHTALSHVSWINWIRTKVTLEFSFCKTEMVEISYPYHPCAIPALCHPGAFQQGGSNAPERQRNSQRPPEVFPVSPGPPWWFRFAGASNSASGALKADSACHGANRHSKHDETCHNMSYRKHPWTQLAWLRIWWIWFYWSNSFPTTSAEIAKATKFAESASNCNPEKHVGLSLHTPIYSTCGTLWLK